MKPVFGAQRGAGHRLFQLAESLGEGGLQFRDLLFELFQTLGSLSFLRSLFLCTFATGCQLLDLLSDGGRTLLVAEFAPELCGQAEGSFRTRCEPSPTLRGPR